MPEGGPLARRDLQEPRPRPRAYEALAQGGGDAFYRGAIARDIVAFSRRHGGFFAEEDLAADKPDWASISTDYRGVQVYELPPTARGSPPCALNVMETFDVKGWAATPPPLAPLRRGQEARVRGTRPRFVADPAFHKASVEWLLSKDYARDRARLIDPARAASRIEAGHPPLAQGDTTYLAVADARRNMVSPSSPLRRLRIRLRRRRRGIRDPQRGALFNLKPGLPQLLEPGKRPFHTIIPAFAMKGESPVAFGSWRRHAAAGHAQVIVNLVDFGMNLQERAGARALLSHGLVGAAGTLMTTGGTLGLESGVPADVRRDLARWATRGRGRGQVRRLSSGHAGSGDRGSLRRTESRTRTAARWGMTGV